MAYATCPNKECKNVIRGDDDVTYVRLHQVGDATLFVVACKRCTTPLGVVTIPDE